MSDEGYEVTVSMSEPVIVGLPVVVIVAVGVQTLIMLFIFAKRQITRFTLRNRRGPHVSVGQGCMKSLRREIDRRLEYAAYIHHEPQLMNKGQKNGDEMKRSTDDMNRSNALDRLKELDKVVAGYDNDFIRAAGSNLRSFLIDCLAGPLVGLEPIDIHRFCDMHEHARHSYKRFGEREVEMFNTLLVKIMNVVAENTKKKPVSPKKLTPLPKKAINRPQRRLFMQESIDSSLITPLIQRKSSSVLISADALANATSTPV